MEEIIHSAAVTATTNLGAGVVRTPDGRVIFVPGAVEGDIADVAVTRLRPSYGEGRLLALISPSTHRIGTDCAVFDETGGGCGGCTFRHVSYEHELAVKTNYIKTAFRKCGIDILLDPFLTAGVDAARSKVTVPVSGGMSGYYAQRSHKIAACEHCHLHDAETDEIRVVLTKAQIPRLHHITVRRGTGADNVRPAMVILRCGSGMNADAVSGTVGELRAMFPFVTSVWLETDGVYTHLAGDEAIYDTLAGCRFRISPDSFYQVNHAGAELLYRRAIEAAELRDGERVADLFCGTGTIGIAAAKSAKIELFGIEINESAVNDAKENAARNGVHARFICGDAAAYEWGDGAPDCVFLDPPRAGCGEELIRHLARVKPGRIVYVSCEPATLARDAARLSEAGYRVNSVTPVDMFPRTGKVECVAEMMSR